jgi:hypothetical protein
MNVGIHRAGERIANWTHWVGQQVVAQDDFQSRGEARSRDYAVLGAATGTVVGASLGVARGFEQQKTNRIQEVWAKRTIVHPELKGYNHAAVPDYRTECVSRDKEGACTRSRTTVDGWWHNYSPRISERVVGHFHEPTFRSTNSWEPLIGGALGALGGGLLGLGVGLGVAALEHSLRQGDHHDGERPMLSPEAEQALNIRAGAAVVGGGLIGTLVGTHLGHQAGVVELNSRQSLTRVWNVPVYKTQTLGHTPSNYYQRNWSGWSMPNSGSSRNADVPVDRPVPVYDRAGDPRLQGTQKVFHTNRYGPLVGGIVGGVIGAGVGLAAGMAIGVGDKLFSQITED